MTVAELIEQLQQMPPDAPVKVHSPYADGELMPVESVDLQEAIPKYGIEQYVWIE